MAIAPEVVREIDVSGIAVRVWGAHHHHWRAGQSFRHLPGLYRQPALQYHLWLVQEGVVEVQSGERLWRIGRGEACFLPTSLERVISTPRPARWLSIGLRIALFNRFNLLHNLPLPAQWHPDDEEFATLEDWMQHLVNAQHNETSHQQLLKLGLSSALFGLCWPHLSAEPLGSPSHQELPPWLAHVLRRIAQEPSCRIADLAHDAGFSPAQFRRTFHKWVGIAPRDYLKNRRLETARHLLETTELPLKDIAAEIGLRDVAHFSQLFKTANGLTPAQYRASVDEMEK